MHLVILVVSVVHLSSLHADLGKEIQLASQWLELRWQDYRRSLHCSSKVVDADEVI